MRLASPDFLLFFFPVTVLVGICLPKKYRALWCGTAGLAYCALQGISVLLPMLLAVSGVRLLLKLMDEPAASHRRRKTLLPVGLFWLLGVILLSRFWYGSVPLNLALCVMQLTELLLIYSQQPQPTMPFGIYYGYCFGLMRLWAGPVLTPAQYEYIIDNCKCTLLRFGRGVSAFVRGLAKLVLLAMPAANVSQLLMAKAEAHTLPLTGAVLGLITMFFSLRYGLGGMAQMGRGMGAMLGYVYPEELQGMPASKTYRGFWEQLWSSAAQWARRVFHTHMPSLRRGVRMLAFGVTAGLLFGRGWNGLIWGLLLALLLWAEPAVRRMAGERIPGAVRKCIVVCLVLGGIGALYADTFGGAVDYAQALIGINGFYPDRDVLYALKTNWASLLGCILLIFPVRSWVKRAASRSRCLNWLTVLFVPLAECLLLIVCMGTLLVS